MASRSAGRVRGVAPGAAVAGECAGVELALRTWPEKTQQAIAEQVGCHKSHVCRIKDQLLTTQQLDPPATVTGKDGKTYPTSKPCARRQRWHIRA